MMQDFESIHSVHGRSHNHRNNTQAVPMKAESTGSSTTYHNLSQVGSDTKKTRQYHPVFCSPDADVVLRSKDGVFFRVHSTTLRMTSGFFRSALSLPQPSQRGNSRPEEVIPLDEDSSLVAKLLSVVSGHGLYPNAISTFACVADLLYAGEKYEMPGVISSVRLGISHPRFLSDPLQLYGLCCRYGWLEEAKQASSLSLSLDISDPVHYPSLASLDGPSLVALLQLRWMRLAGLKAALNGNLFFKYDDPVRCVRCNTMCDMHAWTLWKQLILEEFARIPSGETVLCEEFFSRPQALRVFAPFCSNKGCERDSLNKRVTMQKIKACVDSLSDCI